MQSLRSSLFWCLWVLTGKRKDFCRKFLHHALMVRSITTSLPLDMVLKLAFERAGFVKCLRLPNSLNAGIIPCFKQTEKTVKYQLIAWVLLSYFGFLFLIFCATETEWSDRLMRPGTTNIENGLSSLLYLFLFYHFSLHLDSKVLISIACLSCYYFK